jgi:hypothetical protein
MSRSHAEELDAMRAEALSKDARRAFHASARAVEAWDRAHPVGLEAILDWIDELRALFGDAPVDRRPWRGDDFRL